MSVGAGAFQRGDIADQPTHSSPQTLLKYVYSTKALKLMDYTAVSFGESEVHFGLSKLLEEFALNEPKPRVVVSNLIDMEKNFPIIPCSLCGSQDNLQRKLIGEMLAEWRKRHPGRIESILRAMAEVRPSHLLDRKLFDFARLK